MDHSNATEIATATVTTNGATTATTINHRGSIVNLGAVK